MLVYLPRFTHKPIGYLIGIVFYILPIKRNLYSKRNINLCFKDLTPNQKKKIYTKNILNTGMVIITTGIAWFWSNERINRSIKYSS